jgi:hypothetical protein
MKSPKIKELIIRSMDANADPEKIPGMLEEEGVSFSFGNGFQEKVLNKLFLSGAVINREIEYIKYLNFAFNRIALSAVAAIFLLIISIYLREGSLSLNSFFGLRDSYDESIICMLTGK